MNYSTFDAGGIRRRADPEMDGKIFQGNDTLIYVQSDDVDANLNAPLSLGGKKLIARPIFPAIAQYAVVEFDPAGNPLRLLEIRKIRSYGLRVHSSSVGAFS